jgi:hypothetical protein
MSKLPTYKQYYTSGHKRIGCTNSSIIGFIFPGDARPPKFFKTLPLFLSLIPEGRTDVRFPAFTV